MLTVYKQASFLYLISTSLYLNLDRNELLSPTYLHTFIHVKDNLTSWPKRHFQNRLNNHQIEK